MTELYKILNGIALPIMNSLFNFRANIRNIRNFQEIITENNIIIEIVEKNYCKSTLNKE